jgi:transposase
VIQVTPQMRILVAVEPADFRKGIDGLARLARDQLSSDPFSGCVLVFRNRRASAVKLLVYDGQGFWLCHKRLSKGRFRFWPDDRGGRSSATMEAHELTVLLSAGDFRASRSAPVWRRVREE